MSRRSGIVMEAMAATLGVRRPGLPGQRERRVVLVVTALLLVSAPFLNARFTSIGLALCALCLPLARGQANLLWWLLLRAPRSERWAARHSSDRELLHKALWAFLFGADQLLLLGPRTAWSLWSGAPFTFSGLLLAVLLATTAILFESVRRGASRPRAGRWVWLGVQSSVAWEEVLYRGLLCSVLWPLLEVPAGAASPRWILAATLAGALFALPHWKGGRPSGPRGVALTFALGVACLVLDGAYRSVLPGYFLHGALLGTLGFLSFWRAREQVRHGVRGERALFLLRLRHGWYVTDWEGDRVLFLTRATSLSARRLRSRIACIEGISAFNRDELELLFGAERPAPSAGLLWLRERQSFLVVASPEGSLPDAAFPRTAHSILEALADLHTQGESCAATAPGGGEPLRGRAHAS